MCWLSIKIQWVPLALCEPQCVHEGTGSSPGAASHFFLYWLSSKFFRHGAQSGLFSASFHMRMALALLQSRHVGTLFSLVVCLCCIFARVISAVYVSVIDAAIRLVMKAMRSLGTLWVSKEWCFGD